jgi:hypothetical protein
VIKLGDDFMAIVNFNRVEKKYLLTREQAKNLLITINEYIKEDAYFETEINNIYFDTDSSMLIRTSLEKPVYKEKLRLRSYGSGQNFLEIKKKYNKVVYKRRVPVLVDDDYTKFDTNSQIGKEIEYLFNKYQPEPKMYIGYKRKSYKSHEGKVRVTFDDEILYRDCDLDSNTRCSGNDLLDSNLMIMEIKVEHAMPLWLAEGLNKHQIYPTSFSKYGEAFKAINYGRQV